ncbi:fatty acid desaturase [Nitzschia inconspicua]|uniref:Fatty acid desaturase n=1 Tax=Nitzschia inconspicua TaxID=303405 RepID=A0A9K3KH53_9STRA|nr:fatty acid desaturase [Nitzschia inconspicua]
MCRPDYAKDTSARAPAAVKNCELSKDDEWLVKFDFTSFSEEIRALGKKLEMEQGPADVAHLNKMIRWSNSFAAVGLMTMGFGVNPISIICLSLYTFSRWTMIAHHVCHGGYEKCHPNKNRWSRFKFALGTLWRRFNDWFDWMMPEAWNVEHNTRHHYNLSEVTDPDLVENNLQFLRELQVPVFVKYTMVAFFALTWKWFYYAPNTYKELKLARMRRDGVKIPPHINPSDQITFKSALFGENYFYSFAELITVVLAPYLLLHFFIIPLPYLALGQQMGYGTSLYWNAVKNLFLAEFLTNAHGFLAVVTNHAGDDMYRFRRACRPFSGSFYLRQVLASVDYSMGTDAVDFLHGWLNYQIEHHMWPNLSMLSYQKSAPLVQEICRRHNVPYIKESVFLRLKKTVDIMVGNTSMRWFPEPFENLYLERDAIVEAAALKSE